MASYYDRGEERYGGERDYRRGGYDENRRGRYADARERDPGWEAGRQDPGRFNTGWPEDYERGYSSEYYTGDAQGRGFAGGRDFGRSYTPSYDRGLGETPEAERGHRRPYGTPRYGAQHEPYAERHYEGTYRPPNYGRDFDSRRKRTYRGEGLAEDRDWFDRTSDEVASWFGDEGAERRRHIDKIAQGNHRGHGPKGYRRSDERIKEDVNDRLTDHPYLDASDIVVSVKEAEVTLSGTVDHRHAKRMAENVAESVSGVKNVQNNLRVGDEQVSAAGLATASRNQ